MQIPNHEFTELFTIINMMRTTALHAGTNSLPACCDHQEAIEHANYDKLKEWLNQILHEIQENEHKHA